MLILHCLKKLVAGVVLTAAAVMIIPTTSQASQLSTTDQKMINELNHRTTFPAGKAGVDDPASKQWPTNHITFELETKSPYYQAIYKAAMHRWNQTGVVHLSLVNQNADVDLKVGNSPIHGRLGDTFFNYQINPLPDHYCLFNSVTCYLYQNVLKNCHYNLIQREHSAEHEMGHSLGLDHVNVPSAVMYPYIRYNTISWTDIRGLRKVYQHQYPNLVPSQPGSQSAATSACRVAKIKK